VSNPKLFLKFTGPGIILIQSRAPRLSDTFTAKDIAEVGELDPSAKEAIIEKIQRYYLPYDFSPYKVWESND
jgi:hypothetical protein